MPSWSNSLWQGWSCGLVYCSGGNATEPIWRVLASSYSSQISHHPSQTPCLPLISYTTQNWCSIHARSSIHARCSIHVRCSIHARCSKSSLKHSIRCFCGIFSKFKTEFYCISFSKESWRPDCIFKSTSCDNQALVGVFQLLL